MSQTVSINNSQNSTYTTNEAHGFGIANLFKAAYEAYDFEKIFALHDDDDKTEEPIRRSKPGRAVINCNRKAGATMLLRDYFSSDPIYQEHILQRRFRVSRKRIFDICSTLNNNNSIFSLRKDATGLDGLNCFQKFTAVLRQIVYGVGIDMVDKYVQMGESTTLDYLKELRARL